MKLTKANGETTLVFEPNEFEPFFRTIGSYDNDTPRALKERLGRILDPVLQGQKLDYIKVNNDTYGRGEILSYIYRLMNLKYDTGKRSAIVLADYISGPAISRLMDTYPALQKLFRQDYDKVMGELKEKAAEYEAQDTAESAEMAKRIGTDFSGPVPPPSGYPLAKYGSRRTRGSRKRRTRKTNRRKY